MHLLFGLWTFGHRRSLRGILPVDASAHLAPDHPATMADWAALVKSDLTLYGRFVLMEDEMATREQMEIAEEWLRLNEGDGAEGEACQAVADWLKREIERRARDTAIRAGAKACGVSYRAARAAFDRLETKRAAGVA